ncbi:MAG: glycoside hydrolase family 2 TIM barrel-domain containing protein [Eubacteriales bacterium]|nr:glycoside hydrolase family 2 TIM barrel-domain containing protein [Eubacteriales bacterium]
MKKQEFNHGWYFGFGHAAPDHREYIAVTLPHDFSILQPIEKGCPSRRDGGYFPGGHGIYIKSFEISDGEMEKDCYIEFEGIYMNAEVWLNGNLLGRHPYGYTSFYYKLNPYLRPGKNELKVTADNTSLPNSRWYSGSGIYRPVWLYTANRMHIAPRSIAVKTDTGGRVEVSCEIEGDSAGTDVRYSIFDDRGNTVASATGSATEAELNVRSPRLWNDLDPYLYTLRTELLRGGEVIDSTDTSIGIRTVEVDAVNGLRINGKPVKLKGGCVHHDNGILGAASYPRSEERKVELLKASGYNAVRCAHNPPSPSFLDACDRLGMYVIDEAFDAWRQPKMPYDYHLFFDDWWERDIASMVKRDRCHPSVIIWSIGNEVAEQYGTSGCYETARKLSAMVRSIDATRPVTQAINGVGRNTDGTFETLDIAGYNYDYHKYEEDHALFPDRVMVGSETVPKLAYENWSVVASLPYVVGDFVWTSIDYLGEAGIGRTYYAEEYEIHNRLYDFPWNKANCGDIDVCGFKRPQSYYRDIMWGVRDKPYIAVRRPVDDDKLKTECTTFWGWNDNLPSWDFTGYEGRTMLVDVYAPGENVRLFLNGRLVGEKPLYNNDDRSVYFNHGETRVMPRYAALFEVPYEPGELVAIGDNGGSFSVKTSGKPAAVTLTPDRETIGADGDLCYVTVEVTDFNRNPCRSAADMIYFSVDNGRLLALGTSNPKDTEPYTGNAHSVYDGRLMAVVLSDGRGDIRLRAMADNLRSDEIVIKTES